MEELKNKILEVWLARVCGWDGQSIVGIFKTEDSALRASIEYLLKESVELSSKEIKTPINKRTEEWGVVWDISNSSDTLYLTKEEVK
jgi:hypothetical protein